MNSRIKLTERRLENITKGVGTNKILSLYILFFSKTVNLATLQPSKVLIEAGLIRKHTVNENTVNRLLGVLLKRLSWYHTTFHKNRCFDILSKKIFFKIFKTNMNFALELYFSY